MGSPGGLEMRVYCDSNERRLIARWMDNVRFDQLAHRQTL